MDHARGMGEKLRGCGRGGACRTEVLRRNGSFRKSRSDGRLSSISPLVQGGKYALLFRFFMPTADLAEKERKEKVNYRQWIREGWIIETPGAYIDRGFIYQKMVEDSRKFSIQEIAFDPALSRDITPLLLADGFNCVEFRQGFLSMAPAVKSFELAALRGEMAGGGNPVMKWMIACSEIVTDAAGCAKVVKPDRAKTGKHIDGTIASIMAHYRAEQTYKPRSVYEDRGFYCYDKTMKVICLGFLRCFDIYGLTYLENTDKILSQTDEEAIRLDWENAIKEFDKTIEP